MGNYKTDHGFQIKHRSSDPTNPVEGEIWYNSTTQKLKVTPLIGAMSSGGNYPIAVYSHAGAGTQTAALGTGGLSPGTNPTNTAATYDGSSWTAITNSPASKGSFFGSGTQTAAIFALGSPYPFAESYTWNGSAWSDGPDVNTERTGCQGGGTTTAAVIYGGEAPGPSSFPGAKTEEFNGSSWSHVEDTPAATSMHGACGTQTAGFVAGGQPNPSIAERSMFYDGTNYSSGPNLPDGYQLGDGMWGTQTAAMAARAYVYGPPNTETNHILEYDGTSWSKLSATCTQSIAAAACGKFGTSDSGVVFGGQPPHSQATEEWSRSATVRTVDTST